MADVQGFGVRRRQPRIETLMDAIESTCRLYDKRITSCIWILALLIVWFVVAGALIRVDDIHYDGALVKERSVPVQVSERHDMRVLHRIFGIMAQQCADGDSSVVIGPQVHVNGKPYMHRVMRLCDRGVDVMNPTIAVAGSTTGTCVDEYDGAARRVSRRYPITVHSDDNVPMSLMDLPVVCTFMQALDMLDGIW